MTDATSRKEVRQPTHHHVKCVQPYFDQVLARTKLFEIRLNDRNYQTGDLITQREYIDGNYTGREVTAKIGYVTDFQQQSGYVVFSLLEQDDAQEECHGDN